MTSLDDLYNVFHTIKDERLDKIKLDIEDDILPLFNNQEESKDSRGDIWQYWFNGKIDDLAIWDRALTSKEIKSLYNR